MAPASCVSPGAIWEKINAPLKLGGDSSASVVCWEGDHSEAWCRCHVATWIPGMYDAQQR